MKNLLLIISTIVVNLTFGQATRVDSSFGINGITTTKAGSWKSTINDIALQEDGKIIAVGQTYSNGIGIARYYQNGELDLTFGIDGKLGTVVSHYDDIAESIAIQPDGKVLVIGNIRSGDYFFLIRYNEDGSLDETFNYDGIVKIRFGEGNKATSLAIQSDGKIVIGGIVMNIIDGDLIAKFCIARFDKNGQLDNTFNNNGFLLYSPLKYSKGGYLAIQPDGRILMAGSTENEDIFHYSENRYLVFRVTGSGRLDSTFNGNGVRLGVESLIYEHTEGIALQDDGKIIIIGNSVRRLLNSGELDSSFGQNGSIKISKISLNSIALEPGGKIILAGYSYKDNSSGHNFSWIRLNKDGQPDCSVVLDHSWYNDEIHSVLVQPDGKILVAGSSEYDFAMARFMGDTITTFKGYKENSLKSFLYPNPFKDNFTIEYTIEKEDYVTITLSNLQGYELVKLMESRKHTAGNYKRYFYIPENLANGIYILGLESKYFKRKIRIFKAG